MALTNAQVREILSTAGVAAESLETAVQAIMNGHITSINALREERDGYKAEAEKLPGVQAELDAVKAKGDPDWQKKFEDEHTAFENYKEKVQKDEEKAQKVELYKDILKECKIEESRIPSILKITDFDSFAVKDGSLDDLDKIKADIEKDYSGFIMKEKSKGAEVETPPANEGGDGNEPSRAAQIAAEYHKNLYGETKGE